MDRCWLCPLCPDAVFEAVKILAAHVELWHEEWLDEGRVPPMVYNPPPLW